jgi:hypothetical protein
MSEVTEINKYLPTYLPTYIQCLTVAILIMAHNDMLIYNVVQWNLFWETTPMRDHLSWETSK